MQSNFITVNKRTPRPRKGDRERNAWLKFATARGVDIDAPQARNCTGHYRVFTRHGMDPKEAKNRACVYIACRDRYCPHCIGHHARRRRADVRERLQAMVERGNTPWFITLTVRKSTSPGEDIAKLRAGMRKLVRRKWFRKNVERGTWVIEWTCYPGRRPHIHLHAVVEPKINRMNQKRLKRELREQWNDIFGDRLRTDLKRLRRQGGRVVNYLAKYVSKYWPHPRWKEMSDLMKGQQTIGQWGKFSKKEKVGEWDYVGTTLDWSRKELSWGGIQWEPVVVPLRWWLEKEGLL